MKKYLILTRNEQYKWSEIIIIKRYFKICIQHKMNYDIIYVTNLQPLSKTSNAVEIESQNMNHIS